MLVTYPFHFKHLAVTHHHQNVPSWDAGVTVLYYKVAPSARVGPRVSPQFSLPNVFSLYSRCGRWARARLDEVRIERNACREDLRAGEGRSASFQNAAHLTAHVGKMFKTLTVVLVL